MHDYNLVCADKLEYQGCDDCSFLLAWSCFDYTQSITRVSTLESMDNFSDHLPLVFTLDLRHPFPWHATSSPPKIIRLGSLAYLLSLASHLGCYFKVRRLRRQQDHIRSESLKKVVGPIPPWLMVFPVKLKLCSRRRCRISLTLLVAIMDLQISPIFPRNILSSRISMFEYHNVALRELYPTVPVTRS